METKRPFTVKQLEFLQALKHYGDEIADNGNIMAETGWNRREVQSVGRGLVRRGMLTYSSTQDLGFEGGIWTRVEGKTAKKTEGKETD